MKVRQDDYANVNWTVPFQALAGRSIFAFKQLPNPKQIFTSKKKQPDINANTGTYHAINTAIYFTLTSK